MCFVDLHDSHGVDNAVTPVRRSSVNELTFGVTRAKKFPPYVFSINGNALLVHRVAYVQISWWRISNTNYDMLVKVLRPKMTAHTRCQQVKFLDSDRARTCVVPQPAALLCGACHGDAATFGRNGRGTKEGIAKQWAKAQLGCVVNGY